MDDGLICFVVLSAGVGRRMGRTRNKMFLDVKGIPILYRTLKRAELIPAIHEIVLVMKDEDLPEYQTMVKKFSPIGKIKKIITGGKERADSVKNALRYVSRHSQSRVVMIHDGARPFFTSALIAELGKGLTSGHINVPSLPMTDTIRKVEAGKASRVIDRSGLYLAQTPQAFLAADIDVCFFSPENENMSFTDDASYFEHRGYQVNIVPGEKTNIKITTPDDIEWSECLLDYYSDLRLPEDGLKKGTI